MRRLPGLLLVLACLVTLAGLSQPASARPQAQVNILPMQVMINEVAWGGTPANSTHEWIELYNPGQTPVILTGWHLDLKSADGTTLVASIPLAPNNLPGNTLPAGGYFLMERYEAATSVQANLLYDNTIELVDTGMVLQLWNGTALNDTANGNGGSWPAGTNTGFFCSMERVPGQQDTDNAWRSNNNIITNGTDVGGNPLCATPLRANSTTPFTPVPSDTPTPDRTIGYPLRSVVINEVAWMGTRANHNSQWLELYNPGAADIDLNGWVLRSAQSTLLIRLTGKIKAGGYFLLERNDDTAVNTITADQIFFTQIPSGGEGLLLVAPNGGLIDTADQLNGPWPAGNYNSACSMERARPDSLDVPTSWFTFAGNVFNASDINGNPICGTPRSVNWAVSVTPTASMTPTPTRTPYPPYWTYTPSPTPKKSPTPTRNPYAPTPSSIVLNEFLPQPRSDWNGDGKIDSGDEFIEIINLGANAVLLNNWSLDDQPGDSNPYYITNVTIQAKARLVFFTSQTGILLSSGGDTVRLLSPSRNIVDAFTYGVVQKPDQTWCRLPDGGQTWVFGCTPTITTANRMAQTVIVGKRVEPTICLSNKLPAGVQLAECDSSGLSAWDDSLWADRPPYPLYLDAGADIYILE